MLGSRGKILLPQPPKVPKGPVCVTIPIPVCLFRRQPRVLASGAGQQHLLQHREAGTAMGPTSLMPTLELLPPLPIHGTATWPHSAWFPETQECSDCIRDQGSLNQALRQPQCCEHQENHVSCSMLGRYYSKSLPGLRGACLGPSQCSGLCSALGGP